MWFRLIFLLFSFILLGEFSILLFLNVAPIKQNFWLSYSIIISFIFSFIMANDKRNETLRRYIQLESLFILGMILYIYMLYTTKNHPLVSFGYFMIYAMVLSSFFIFREFSSYLYILSSSLLVGVSQIYQSSIIHAGIYLTILIFAVISHNDYVNYKYNRVEVPQNRYFPGGTLLFSIVLSLMLMIWMSHTTPEISNYLDNLRIMRQRAKNDRNNHFVDKNTRHQDQQNNRSEKIANNEQESSKNNNKQNNTSKQKENHSQPNTLQDHSQVSMNNDLKFGDIEMNNIEAQALFEVQINTEAYNTLQNHNLEMYWKLGHLDTYDSKNGYWYLQDSSQEKLAPNKEGFISIHPLPQAYIPIWQKYFFGGEQNRMFYLANPIFQPTTNIWKDKGDNLFIEPQNYYEVLSYITYDLEDDIDFTVDSRYLKVPRNINAYKKMAQRITKNASSNYQKIKKIEAFLKRNYEYDLKPGIRADKGDVTYQFLFTTYRGYCQHFSSAMVLLLRSIGIPARVAVGCKGGILNKSTLSYTLSNIDRHAWVEVPTKRLGWVNFDPVGEATSSLQNQFDKKFQEIKSQNDLQNIEINPSTNSQLDRKNDITSNNKSEKEMENSPYENKLSERKNSQRNTKRFDQKSFENKLSHNSNKRENKTNKTPSSNNEKSQDQDKQRKSLRKTMPHKLEDQPEFKLNREFKTRQEQENHFLDRLTRNKKNKDNTLTAKQDNLRQNFENKSEEEKRTNITSPESWQTKEEKVRNNTKESHVKINERKKSHVKTNENTSKVQQKKDEIKQKDTLKLDNKNLPDGIITFIKNISIFCVSLLFFLAFFYIIPALVKWIGRILKFFFNKEKKSQQKEEFSTPLKRIINNFLPGIAKANTERGKVIYAYSNLSRKLEKYGLEKKFYQTPREYQNFLYKNFPADSHENLTKLTKLFIKAKYSCTEIEKQDANAFEEYCKRTIEKAKKYANTI